MMKKTAPLVSILSAISAVAGYSQPTSPGTLNFDTSKMKINITLDQKTYLPGEVAQVTLEVSNPSGAPVLSLTPFISATGCLFLRQRVGTQLRGFETDNCGSSPVDNSNTTTFGPGESKRIMLNSFDNMFDIGPYVMEGGAVPEISGTFGITSRYGSTRATAEYTVAPAKLEADVTVRVRDVMFTDHPDLVPPQAVRGYVHVLALRSNGISYICVQQAPVASSDSVARKSDMGENLEFALHHVNIALALRFKRVATSAAPIVDLSAMADAQENLTIRWTDSAGGEHSLYYPASYPARPASHNQ